MLGGRLEGETVKKRLPTCESLYKLPRYAYIAHNLHAARWC